MITKLIDIIVEIIAYGSMIGLLMFGAGAYILVRFG